MQESARRRRATAAAQASGADGLLVTHGPDVRYLSGFTGSSGAVALLAAGRGARAVLFTDGRYTEQAKAEAAGLRVVIGKGAPGGLAAAWLAENGTDRCAFDATQTTVAALNAMRGALPAAKRRSFFLGTDGLVAKLREIKDEDEAVRMRKAAKLGCRLFDEVLTKIVPGQSEMEIALAMEMQARLAGADGMSFETIVASGTRSSLPHGRATGQKLPRRGFVTLDFGVVLDGYCSDMTRTVHLGRASGRERDVYHSVLEAQEAAVAAVRPGVTCESVDQAARGVLEKAKLGKWFSHSTGHGVGLEIHEGPRVAAKSKQVLEEGMVITVEPGVYLPGEFGVRIEDMVLVTKAGGEVLTAASPKAWIEL